MKSISWKFVHENCVGVFEILIINFFMFWNDMSFGGGIHAWLVGQFVAE